MNFLDLFCGCGGTSEGFRQAGFVPKCAVDINEDAINTYKKNFEGTEAIVGNIRNEETQNYLINKYKNIPLLIGCPPCQAFSKRNLNSKHDDVKNELPIVFSKFALNLNPDVIFMEEVPQCQRILPDIKSILQDKYIIKHKVIYASNHNVPQKRKRFILIAHKNHIEFQFPHDKAEISVDIALNMSPRCSIGPLVSEKTKIKIQDLELSKKRLIGGNYAIMDTSKPSPTIHTQTHSCTGPYTIKRGINYHTLSLEETARIQSFPHTFLFTGSVVSKRRQIGNAVPPKLAQDIAEQITWIQT